MILQIKELQGNEKTLEVSAEATVFQLKEVISNIFKLPVDRQRLMYKGKTLANEKTLKDYNVEEGCKVHLFRLNEGSSENLPPGFWSDLNSFLRGHFDGDETAKIIDYMKKDLSENINSLSLDDIERIAFRRLNPEND